jgi:hypothetical protein
MLTYLAEPIILFSSLPHHVILIGNPEQRVAATDAAIKRVVSVDRR